LVLFLRVTTRKSFRTSGKSEEVTQVYIKCIIEICYLDEYRIIDVPILTVLGGTNNVKTSTGFGKSGETPEAVSLMRKTVGPKFGVKAAGGIRTKEAARGVIEAGATRIGASSASLFE